ncbi:MAG TPA: hypothetical protein VLJ42_08825 [Solirubrobacteraceae bacterium]|nr:hypothetical protein [Solirubrobacteraceae bacterium]
MTSAPRAESRRSFRRAGVRGVIVGLALMAPATSALAATGTTNYNQTPATPTPSTPNNGTGPSSSSSTPTTTSPSSSGTSAAPTSSSSTPSASTSSTLPRTGLDLRLVLAGGLLLMLAGLGLSLAQRRQHD